MPRSFAICCVALGQATVDNECSAMLQKTDVTSHLSTYLGDGLLLGSSGDTMSQLSAIEAVTNKMMANPASWSQAEKTMLQNLRNTLTDNMEAFLTVEQSSDQIDYNIEKVKHQTCIDSKTKKFAGSGDVSTAWALVVETKKKHKSCRKSEKSWWDYKNFRVVADSCLNSGDISSLHVLAARDVQLLAKLNAVQTNAQEYRDLPATGTSDACSTDQVRFENSYCAWHQEKYKTCTDLESCVALVDLASAKTKYNGRQDNRIALWGVIQKMKCSVDLMISSFVGGATFDAGKFKTSDTCHNLVNTHTFSLTLEVPAPPSCASDADLTVSPSQQDSSKCSAWMAQEYNVQSTTAHGYDLAVHHAVTDCQSTCAGTAPGGTATGTATSNVGMVASMNVGGSPIAFSPSAPLPGLEVDLNAATKSWRIELKIKVELNKNARGHPIILAFHDKPYVQVQSANILFGNCKDCKDIRGARPDDMSKPHVYEFGWDSITKIKYMKFDGKSYQVTEPLPQFFYGTTMTMCTYYAPDYDCSGTFYYVKVFMETK